MQFASIFASVRLPRPAALSALAFSFLAITAATRPADAQNSNDDVILQMKQAAQRGDKARLTALLPEARGHVLEPWAAYWEMKARLQDVTLPEIQEFLARYAGTYQE